MDDVATNPPAKRSLWLRLLYMLLMAVAFQITASVLCVVAFVQFVLALVSDGANARLARFGGDLGRYLRQIAGFVSFAREELPFPFTEWPSES